MVNSFSICYSILKEFFIGGIWMGDKRERCCCHCNKSLPEGISCVATNIRHHGMNWLCRECFDLYTDILDAKAHLAIASRGRLVKKKEELSDLISCWDSRRVGEETVFDQEVKFGIED